MSQKNKLSLSVQYPDLRLATLVTRPLVRRWVQAALFAPARSSKALGPSGWASIAASRWAGSM